MNKILFLILLFPSIVVGADINRYVNPGSSGGNGTTSALTGANAAYVSLSAAEAAEQCNLTDNGGDVMIINCAGSTVDAAACTFSGWTTGATNYIDISGDWDAESDLHYTTNKYHITVQNLRALSFSNSTTINVNIHNIQIYQNDVDTDNCDGIFINCGFNGSIYNNLLRGNDADDWYDIGIYIESGFNVGLIKIFNNWIFDWGTDAGSSGGITVNANSTTPIVYIENNTFHENYAGIHVQDGTIETLNNIVFGSGNTLAYVEAGGTHAQDYNSTDGTDVTGQGGNSHTSHTFSFVDSTNANHGLRNFHLLSTDTGALDLGTSTISGGYTTDIDGVTRSGTWDIGADEYVAATPPAAAPSESWIPTIIQTEEPQ
jgi:hypothetical protein